MKLAIVLSVLIIGASAEAASRFNRTRLSWQWVEDSWTQYFRADCGTESGNYTWWARTTATTTSLNIYNVITRRSGTYYCIVRGVNDSDPTDPLGDASNETVFTIEGNWVYPAGGFQ